MVNLSGFLNREMDSLQLQQQFYDNEDMSGLEVDEIVMNGSNGFDDVSLHTLHIDPSTR